jgi:hypothetical protein
MQRHGLVAMGNHGHSNDRDAGPARASRRLPRDSEGIAERKWLAVPKMRSFRRCECDFWKIFGNHGKFRAKEMRLYILGKYVTNIQYRRIYPDKPQHNLPEKRQKSVFPRLEWKIMIAMGGFPIVSREHGEDGITEGQQDPRTTPKSGFIQAPGFIERRVPARERADIPPGGARSRIPPLRRDDGGVIGGSRSARRFLSGGSERGGAAGDRRDSGPDIQGREPPQGGWKGQGVDPGPLPPCDRGLRPQLDRRTQPRADYRLRRSPPPFP